MSRVHIIYPLPRFKFIFRRLDSLYRYLFKEPLYRRFFITLSWSKPLGAPYSITYNLIQAFHGDFSIRIYDWNETGTMTYERGDIYIGHPKPDFLTKEHNNNSWKHHDENQIFNKLVIHNGPQKNIFVISPFNNSIEQVGWLMPLLSHCRTFIGIGGDVWQQNAFNVFPSLKQLNFRMVNMAIDESHYPYVKQKFNPKGKRKFLYIGRTSKEKGVEILSRMASELPQLEIGYISSGEIPNCKKISTPRPLTVDYISELSRDYDVFINTSLIDAQATTILEAMSWGFAIACTRESGYAHPSIFRLSIDDIDHNKQIVNRIQNASEEELLSMQNENRKLLATKYSWRHFTAELIKITNQN